MSGGEQQRTAIAVALANKPPLLLADEPTGELDDTTAGEILDLFGTVNHQMGTTILIVTHDPDIAYKVGRVAMIRDGKMSTEIRRKVAGQRITSTLDTAGDLEEFTLVDSAGRLQIPREYMDKLNIGDKTRVTIEEGKVILAPEDN